MSVPRSLSPDELAMRLQQQELVAQFGLLALSSVDLPALMQEAAALAARGLRTTLAKVLRFRERERDLLVVAGVGWRAGVVGSATVDAGPDSPAGYALQTGRPVLTNDLAEESRFHTPSILAEHGVQSAINVVIGPVRGASFGVLEADSTRRREFAAADTAFLQGVADVLAASITRADADAAKEVLLREKDLLMQEVHHRVKNSLHLVRNILTVQARNADPAAQQSLDEAARRVMTIGTVHHRLYAGVSVAEANAAEFLEALLADMRQLMPDAQGIQDLRLRAAHVSLSADGTTALGIVVSELVTNALKHGARPILVELEQRPEGLLITVEDSGGGFPPDFEPVRSPGLGMRLIASLATPGGINVDRSGKHGRISVLLKR